MLQSILKLAVAALLLLTLSGSTTGLFARPGPQEVKAPPAQSNKVPVKTEAKSTEARKLETAANRPKGELEIARRLAERVDFSGFEDPKTRMSEALDQLTRRYAIDFEINEKAFKFDMVPDVLTVEIAQPNPIPEMKTSLDRILRKVLARIPAQSGAAFLIRRDVIEITTCAAIRSELRIYNEPGDGSPVNPQDDREYIPPTLMPYLVTHDVSDVTLSQALGTLSDLSGVSIVIDQKVCPDNEQSSRIRARFRNVPVHRAVRVLANMEDLQMVDLGNFYYVTSPEKAERLRAELKKASVVDKNQAKEPEAKPQVGAPKPTKPEK